MMSSIILRLLLFWMPFNVDSTCRKVRERVEATAPTRYHNTFWNKKRLGSHLLKHWRFHTNNFGRKLNIISIQGHTKPYSTKLHYRSTACPDTMVGSVRYRNTLLQYSVLFELLSYTQLFYIAEFYPNPTLFVEVYPFILCCWAIFKFNTLLISSQSQYIAELQPTLTHCWGIPNLNTLLRKTQYYYIAELHPILTHCWSFA